MYDEKFQKAINEMRAVQLAREAEYNRQQYDVKKLEEIIEKLSDLRYAIYETCNPENGCNFRNLIANVRISDELKQWEDELQKTIGARE